MAAIAFNVPSTAVASVNPPLTKSSQGATRCSNLVKRKKSEYSRVSAAPS